MDRREHKELDTIDIKKLTKFQKNQVISLVDRFIEDNTETSKGSFNVCPKCGKDYKGREDEGWEADVSVPWMRKEIR